MLLPLNFENISRIMIIIVANRMNTKYKPNMQKSNFTGSIVIF